MDINFNILWTDICYIDRKEVGSIKTPIYLNIHKKDKKCNTRWKTNVTKIGKK